MSSVGKIVKRALKILQQVLQYFYRAFDHFKTLHQPRPQSSFKIFPLFRLSLIA